MSSISARADAFSAEKSGASASTTQQRPEMMPAPVTEPDPKQRDLVLQPEASAK